MRIDIVISRHGKQYLAQAAGLPGIRVKRSSRAAALRGVEERLRSYFDQVEVVRMEIGGVSDEQMPEGFGWLADDPTFEDWQKEIAAFRRTQDESAE
jgi:hypothetical protein